MKKFFSLLLVAILVVTTLSTVAAAKEAEPGATVDIEVTVSGEFANYLIDITADAGLTIKSISGAGAYVINSATSAKANWATSSNVSSHTIIVTVQVAGKVTCEKGLNVTATAQRASKAVPMDQDTDGIVDGLTATTVSVSGGSIVVHHEWDKGVVTTQPTCTSAGVKTFTCSICGETKTEAVAKLEHKFTNYVSDNNATCLKDGTETAKCDNGCGTTDTRTVAGSALGHDKVTVTVDPTCTEAGYTHVTCSRCDLDEKTAIPAAGHKYVATETTATCTKGGITTYVCSVCKHSYTDNETDALGHDYQLVKEDCVAANCTVDGCEVYKCSRCDSTETKVLAALGHKACCSDWRCKDHDHFNDEKHWFICSVCGVALQVEEHTMVAFDGGKECKCGYIVWDESPEPDTGDYRLVMFAGFAALIAMMAAAAYVYKRKFAK